jgi:hypothetical protein
MYGAGSADLVEAHEPGVTGDVGRQYRCQSAFDTPRHERPQVPVRLRRY